MILSSGRRQLSRKCHRAGRRGVSTGASIPGGGTRNDTANGSGRGEDSSESGLPALNLQRGPWVGRQKCPSMNSPSHSGIPLRIKIGRPGRAGCPQPAARGAVRTPRPTLGTGFMGARRKSVRGILTLPAGRVRGKSRQTFHQKLRVSNRWIGVHRRFPFGADVAPSGRAPGSCGFRSSDGGNGSGCLPVEETADALCVERNGQAAVASAC